MWETTTKQKTRVLTGTGIWQYLVLRERGFDGGAITSSQVVGVVIQLAVRSRYLYIVDVVVVVVVVLVVSSGYKAHASIVATKRFHCYGC